MRVHGNIIMGYSVRTDQFRYTWWLKYDYVTYKPIFEGEDSGDELYDHSIDPEENMNRAADPKYKNEVKKLRAVIKAGWRGSLPPKVSHKSLADMLKFDSFRDNDLTDL